MMTKRDLTVSKSRGLWVKKRLNRLLEEFDKYNRHQLREKLERIAKGVDNHD